jgi:hypothetical protein
MRTFNLADNELKSIAAFASRIAVLLSEPDIKADDDQTGVLDDLLGAVYALILAVEEGFAGKPGKSDKEPPTTRAKQVASGQFRADGNWMAGFHFNNAMFRISAGLDRVPKAFTKPGLTAARQYKTKLRTKWKKTYCEKIRDEVNRVKHDAGGVFGGRREKLDGATLALGELLHLVETITYDPRAHRR